MLKAVGETDEHDTVFVLQNVMVDGSQNINLECVGGCGEGRPPLSPLATNLFIFAQFYHTFPLS